MEIRISPRPEICLGFLQATWGPSSSPTPGSLELRCVATRAPAPRKPRARENSPNRSEVRTVWFAVLAENFNAPRSEGAGEKKAPRARVAGSLGLGAVVGVRGSVGRSVGGVSMSGSLSLGPGLHSVPADEEHQREDPRLRLQRRRERQEALSCQSHMHL